MTSPIRAVFFDLLGTLLDVHSIADAAEGLYRGRGTELATLWRRKQLEYTWLRTLSGRYATMTLITEDALHAAAEALGLDADKAACGTLMHAYTQLKPYPDVAPVLKKLAATDHTVGVLSNADPGLLEDDLSSSGLGEYLDLLLSADAVRSFKPAAAVYGLVTQTLNHKADEVGFVSSNYWDASGAQAFGFRSVWLNRTGVSPDRLGVAPAHVARTFDEAVALATA